MLLEELIAPRYLLLTDNILRYDYQAEREFNVSSFHNSCVYITYMFENILLSVEYLSRWAQDTYVFE